MERTSEASIVLLVCLCFCYAEAQQECQKVKDKRCQCSPAEHEVIDIASYFSYPTTTSVSTAEFSFNPCSPFPCASGKPDVVMCMYHHSNAIGLGRYTNGPYWYINTLDPLNFTVTYYDGDKISSTATLSSVTFAYKEDIDMTFSFLYSLNFSSAFIQYEFQVIGPYVYITNSSSNGTSHPHSPVDPGMIAGSIVGSWFILVTLTAVTVTLIISCVVKNDRKKRAGYQPLADQQPENTVQ